MTQKRLNGIAVCHIHQERLDRLDRQEIAQQYVQGNARRRDVFGSFIESASSSGGQVTSKKYFTLLVTCN